MSLARAAALVVAGLAATSCGAPLLKLPTGAGSPASDAAEVLTEQAEDEAIVDDLRQRVAAIDRALGRLESGAYGRSVLSGKPIPDERLEADPAAELTVDEARAQR